MSGGRRGGRPRRRRQFPDKLHHALVVLPGRLRLAPAGHPGPHFGVVPGRPGPTCNFPKLFPARVSLAVIISPRCPSRPKPGDVSAGVTSSSRAARAARGVEEGAVMISVMAATSPGLARPALMANTEQCRCLQRFWSAPGHPPPVASGIRRDGPWMTHRPLTARPYMGVVVGDGMTAGQARPRLLDFIGAAPENGPSTPGAGYGERPTCVQCQQRLAAHGVMSLRALAAATWAKGIGIVQHGRKEIEGADQGQVGAELVHSRIVSGIRPHQQAFIGFEVETARDAGQIRRTQFFPSAGLLAYIWVRRISSATEITP